MTEIIRSGQVGSPGHIDVSQGDLRAQLDAITDAVRQLAGKAEIEPGSTTVNDPLNAPYVLYVNSYTGKDTFVSGDYATADDGTFEQKMRRISLQRLECGYTAARPFRTINRAIIEAGIITSRDYMTLGNICGDLVSIVVAPGTHTILNDEGAASTAAWSDGKVPTDAELIAFNPQSVGGLILPRGCSLVSLDLRKCIMRPNAVPGVADEAPDGSNRRAIFRMTGGGYYYGFTFLDHGNIKASHHLLSCFEFASKAHLDEFYAKIVSSFGGVTGIDPALAVTRSSEYQIVGSFPDVAPTEASDTVRSASPYIYNCSIRSAYGLTGIYCDGNKVDGLRSCVVAQFTGVSLQKDLTCWQAYNAATDSWDQLTSVDFTKYRDTDPDNVRMDPNRRSFHIRARHDAIIQEVSVFAIGQGIHHWVQEGGEITITNSNSNFGGCAALAEGYQDAALEGDVDWSVNRIRVATNLTDESNNVRRIILGKVASSVANSATTILLETALVESDEVDGIPQLVAQDGYTLKTNSLVWIENPDGPDYFARLTSSAWDSASPSEIDVSAAFRNEDGDSPNGTNELPDIAGKRVYIRRLRDTRSIDERRYSLLLNNTNATTRTPLRDYTLQTDVTSGAIDSEIPNTEILVVARSTAKTATGAGVEKSAEVELRRHNGNNAWAPSTFYRRGDVAQYRSKHWICIKENSDASFDTNKWSETFVHMEDGYRPEDFWKNTQPIIIFDDDTEALEASASLGWDLTNDWANSAELREQYRTATDYKALHSFLVSLGFSVGDAHTILLPKPAAARERDPQSALDGIPVPSGAANSWANWSVEFRRPSNMRLFGHAWEWAGFLNYTKALPKYQGELSETNKFTYYFTNQNGGKVYASGFNEEGFGVSARGLEDVETGEVLAPEDVGVSDRAIEIPTSFSSLSVDELFVNSSLIVRGKTIDDSFYIHANDDPEFKAGELWVGNTREKPAVKLTDAGIVFAAPTIGLRPGATIQENALARAARGTWTPNLIATFKPSAGAGSPLQNITNFVPPLVSPVDNGFTFRGRWELFNTTVTCELVLAAPSGNSYPWVLGTTLYFSGLPFEPEGNITGSGYGDARDNLNIYSRFTAARDVGGATPPMNNAADLMIKVDEIGASGHDIASAIIGFVYTVGHRFVDD